MAHRMNGFVKLLIAALLSAALFWIVENHWQHALGLLPYLLFLTCPLMHLFMHHGHGAHQNHSGDDRPA